MLSDEENKAMDSLKVISEYAGDNYLAKEHRRKLKLLIELVEKQSKEIEELKEECKEVVCIPEGTCFMLEPKDVDKKWKDKIKAKIEEIENTGIDVAWEQVNYTIREQDRAKIQVLVSLLEKE